MTTKKTYIAIAIIVAIVIVTMIITTHKHTVTTTQPVGASAMVLENGPTPWPVEWTHLKDRLTTIDLPALAQEGTVLHIHQHLDIAVNGQVVPVPADIGIDPRGRFISPIHVHDTSGIVHVESPTVQTFTLGQFFDIWGLAFTAQCIGGDCINAQQVLKVYVDGHLYQGDPRSIALAAHQEIFVFYGTPAQLPKTIPSSFNFPAGY